MAFMVKIEARRCKGCELCLAACPKKILMISGQKNQSGFGVAECCRPEECTGCLACALVCPDAAIEIFREET